MRCGAPRPGASPRCMPYFGYARQDRKPGPRTPISAKLVANLITQAGADRVLTRRSPRRADPGLLRYPDRQSVRRPGDGARHQGASRRRRTLMVVSPDVGGVVRARALAKRLDTPLAIVDKRRERAGESEVMNIIGDVEGQVLHPDRRHRRFRRHAVQRRRGAAGAGRQGRHRLHHPRRAVGRRGRAHHRLQAQGTGDHRFDPADRGGARSPATSASSPIAPLIGEAIGRTTREESVSSLFD